MAQASAVVVSSIAISGNIVTVTTATPHGLAQNQGFSLTGISPVGLNQNNTVSTAPTSTTFTFNMANAPAYVSGGSVIAAKQVVVLAVNTSTPGQIQITYVLWLTTTSPVARALATSSWTGASTQENAAIAAGTTIEVNKAHMLPVALGKVALELLLATDFASSQAAQASSTQPGQFYGVYFDGTGWSA
jgi:hypothetical protein